MSEGERRHRPTGEPAKPVEGGDEAYVPRDGAHPLASREERIAAEQPRARYQRMMEERGAIAGSLAHRMTVMRKSSGEVSGKPSIPSAGGALDGRTRASMEQHLGAPLGDVKVGTSGQSATAARQLGARAFTVGNEVHFGEGEYAPGTKAGDQLIAHELTHVVQGQRSGIQRKAEGDEAHEGPEVSHPDEPAEKEADAVSEDVADKMHGGDEKDGEKKKGDDKGARPGKQQAPAVAAKLDKIFRAESEKKRGDHVFNNGLGKALGELSGNASRSASSAAKGLAASLTSMQSSVSGDAFHITVNKGAGPVGGDDNSKKFGLAKAAALTAFDGLLAALEELESAPAAEAAAAQSKLAGAASAAGKAFGDMVANAYDPSSAALVTAKSDKALISAAQATLQGLPGTFTGAVTAATTSVAPKKDAPPKDAAAGGAPPAKK